MKRRKPLKRGGPLKRAGALKRGGPLRKVSAKKAAWRERYFDALAAEKAAQIAATGSTFCQRCKAKGAVDGHHPAGQNGARIMAFMLLCRACHDWAHFVDPRAARREGILK